MWRVVVALALLPLSSSLDLNEGAFVHLFEWSHSDVADECEQWLSPKGFKAVQVHCPPLDLLVSFISPSPVLRSPHPTSTSKAMSGNLFVSALISPLLTWRCFRWTRYQPVSYNLTSRSGTEAEMVDMIERCNAVGVSIIADAVVNHMAAAPSTTSYGVGGTAYYPGR